MQGFSVAAWDSLPVHKHKVKLLMLLILCKNTMCICDLKYPNSLPRSGDHQSLYSVLGRDAVHKSDGKQTHYTGTHFE